MPAEVVRQADRFLHLYAKLDKSVRIKLDKLLDKAVLDPKAGKPMRFCRKGTRELYLPPFRLSYAYEEKGGILTFLDLYHTDRQ